MAQPSIHEVSAAQFKAMTPRARVDFLSDVFVAWLPFGEVNADTVSANLPDSYVPMFDRRVRQHAILLGADKKDEAAAEKALQTVLDAAIAKRDALIEAGELVAV